MVLLIVFYFHNNRKFVNDEQFLWSSNIEIIVDSTVNLQFSFLFFFVIFVSLLSLSQQTDNNKTFDKIKNQDQCVRRQKWNETCIETTMTIDTQ